MVKITMAFIEIQLGVVYCKDKTYIGVNDSSAFN